MGSTTTTTTTVAATMTAPAPPSAQATWGAVGSENMDDPALLGCISRTEVPSPDQAPRSSAAPPHEQALPTSSEVSDAGMVQSERTSTSSLCSKDGTLLLPDSSESPLLSSGSTSSISNLHHSNSSTHPGSEAGTNISSRSTGEIRNPSSSSLTPSQAADGRRTMDDYPSLSTPPGLDPPSISSYVHGPREDELPPGDHTEEQRGENVPSQLEGAEVGLAPPPPSAVLAPVECNKSREPGQPTPFRPLLPSAIVAEELSPSSSLPLSPVRLSPSLDTAHAIKQFKPSPRDVISGIAPHVFDERSTRGRRSHSRGRRSARRASLGGYHHQQPVTWQRASPLRRSIVITWDEKSIYLGVYHFFHASFCSSVASTSLLSYIAFWRLHRRLIFMHKN